MLYNKYLPDYHFSSRHSVIISASPSRVNAALAGMDFSGSRLVRLLFSLRGLPAQCSRGMEGLKRMGFTVLEHHSEKEIIFGLIGQFWKINGNIQHCTPEDFTSFSTPGFVKATWNFEIRPIDKIAVELSTQTRIFCTDETARRKFVRYWFFVRPFSGIIRKEMLKLVKCQAESEH